jgi:CDP-6-deoxy-D-xylo-4-hexulose-3-dehydrase
MTGTVSDIGTSSFYPAHHITTGEGGAVYTTNKILHKIIRSMRDWGRDCICAGGEDNHCGHRFDGQYGTLPKGYDHKYVYSHLGYNLKATDMQAAVGCAQLDKLGGFVAARRKNWDYLWESLNPLKDKFILPEKELNSNPGWFGFILTVRPEAGKTKDEIIAFLERNNIQTRCLFSGNIIRHPCFAGLINRKDYRVIGCMDKTDFVMENSFWVGVYPGMTEEMLNIMIDMIYRSLR